MSLATARRFVAARDPETGRWYGRVEQRTHPLAAQWWASPEEARAEVPDFYDLHWIEWTSTKIEASDD